MRRDLQLIASHLQGEPPRSPAVSYLVWLALVAALFAYAAFGR